MIERLRLDVFLMAVGAGSTVVMALAPGAHNGAGVIAGFLVFLVGMGAAGATPRSRPVMGYARARIPAEAWGPSGDLTFPESTSVMFTDCYWTGPGCKGRLDAMGAAMDRIYR